MGGKRLGEHKHHHTPTPVAAGPAGPAQAAQAAPAAMAAATAMSPLLFLFCFI
jgi:hypothetical protein